MKSAAALVSILLAATAAAAPSHIEARNGGGKCTNTAAKQYCCKPVFSFCSLITIVSSCDDGTVYCCDNDQV